MTEEIFMRSGIERKVKRRRLGVPRHTPPKFSKFLSQITLIVFLHHSRKNFSGSEVMFGSCAQSNFYTKKYL